MSETTTLNGVYSFLSCYLWANLFPESLHSFKNIPNTNQSPSATEHHSIVSSGQHRHQQPQQLQQKRALSQPQLLKPSGNVTIAATTTIQAKSSVPLGVKQQTPTIPLSSRQQLHPVKADTAYHRIHAGPPTSAPQNGHSNSQPASESMVIKTSKKWVLPPRPKPGRKPSAAHSSLMSHNHQSHSQSQSNLVGTGHHHGNHATQNHSHKEVPMGKSHSLPAAKGTASGTGVPLKPLHPITASSSSANSANSSKISSRAGSPNSVSLPLLTPQPNLRSVSPEVELHRSKPIAMAPKQEPKGLNVGSINVAANPLKQAIIKVNEENYYLKLEVIKLVSDLKSLRSELMLQRKPLKSIANKPVSPMTVLNEAYSQKIKQENGEEEYLEKEEQLEISAKLETPEPPQTKKRLHDDDDMNDLILSLVDLSHTSKKEDENNSDDDNDNDDNDSTTTAVEPADVEPVPVPKTTGGASQAECLPSGLDHSDDEEADLISSTPDSLLTLTKTNSSIDELELPSSNQCVQSLSGTTDVSSSEAGDFDMPVSWSKMALDDAKIFKTNPIINTSSGFTFQGDFYDNTKVRQRQLERDNEIKKYNVMNELIDFQNHSYEIGDVDVEFDAFMNGGARPEYSSDLSIF
ncbi:unnamed protein product [Kuraishia capsulata CBS 1993]|uniref:Hap4 transcription factor heteromerisation domain-containing protein n=1 Tax=Kuraishia capsulata CBS 1993 TaxID=1382522 RepID=W6MLV3_9ASCO|nr:uncharacterized protein KUCA_T00003464001 [Kuraishia capsulata CBS 1993]CDK27486.1 unnamed protein product [Kuraishia capsulata CBS 1993]